MLYDASGREIQRPRQFGFVAHAPTRINTDRGAAADKCQESVDATSNTYLEFEPDDEADEEDDGVLLTCS